MAYIGNTAQNQAFTPRVDYFSGNGSTVAFTLSFPVASVAQVQAVIENVPQNPSDAFTVSGNTITFTSAPPSGTNNIYVYYTSPITQVIQPGQGTVGLTQLTATGNASASTYLRGDNSWAAIASSQWTTSAANIYYDPTPDNISGAAVGVGTIPGLWSKYDNFKALQVGQYAALASGRFSAYLGYNYLEDNNSTKYINTGTASRIVMGNNIQFQVAPSGTAGSYFGFGSTAMTFTAAGNLTIGTVPVNVWNSSYRAVQVGGVNGLYGLQSLTTGLTSNAFFNVSSQWTYGISGTAARFEVTQGGHKWFIAPSGTAGTAATFTETMAIDVAGNLQFNSGYGSVATAYGCRAWVNFNGTGTVAIRASGNVSSITDNGTGNYTVNLTTAMPDANFAVVVGGRRDTGGSQFDQNTGGYATSTSAASVRTADEGPTAVDFQFISVAILR